MKERPILFSGEMVRAILDGSKTQTRRPLRAQPPPECNIHYMLGNESWMAPEKRSPLRHCWEAWHGDLFENRPEGHLCGHHEVRCPIGAPGDRLWVRETHAQFAVGSRDGTAPQCVAYRATCNADGSFDYVNNGDELMSLRVTKWTPAIHMPRWASRITLEVTEVRVQRLQDISEADAHAEGIEAFDGLLDEAEICWAAKRFGGMATDARTWFAVVWNQLCGALPGMDWAANPWVWAASFRTIEPTHAGATDAADSGEHQRHSADKRHA